MTGPHSTSCTVQDLFEAQVERTPGNLAVVCEDESITYDQLNRWANRQARHLREQGVGVETPVALCLDRSIGLVAAMLATLKAGGAFVPLDPSYPEERLRFMVQDCGAPVVVTSPRYAGRFDGCTVALMDDSLDLSAQAAAENLEPLSTPESLAYVIYTSGSTGTPKGVGVEHRNLVNYITAVSTSLDTCAGQNYAHLSSISADLGYTTLFVALDNAGCLHLLPMQRILDPNQFAGYPHPIDVTKTTPSHLNALLTATNPHAVLPRKHLILGGEPMSRSLLTALWDLRPDLAITNHYGPTETTVGVTTHRLRRRDAGSATGSPPPIGQPIANTRVYLLDEHLRPVPDGAPGELFIAGAGVARGYHNRPGLTAERFLPDPFAAIPGVRMYRSGDRCRRLPDGALEFLGRMDRQIKVRGFRIEPGEVEAVLRGHPDVLDAAVAAHTDAAQGATLVAHYAMEPDSVVGGEDLRAFASERLPAYMVPQHMIRLDRLPMTPTGKVDTKALAAISIQPEIFPNDVARASDVERGLATIWSELLGFSVTAIDQNFFDIGGHSLLVAELAMRIQSRFKVELAISHIYEGATIRELARKVESAIAARSNIPRGS